MRRAILAQEAEAIVPGIGSSLAFLNPLAHEKVIQRLLLLLSGLVAFTALPGLVPGTDILDPENCAVAGPEEEVCIATIELNALPYPVVDRSRLQRTAVSAKTPEPGPGTSEPPLLLADCPMCPAELQQVEPLGSLPIQTWELQSESQNWKGITAGTSDATFLIEGPSRQSLKLDGQASFIELPARPIGLLAPRLPGLLRLALVVLIVTVGAVTINRAKIPQTLARSLVLTGVIYSVFPMNHAIANFVGSLVQDISLAPGAAVTLASSLIQALLLIFVPALVVLAVGEALDNGETTWLQKSRPIVGAIHALVICYSIAAIDELMALALFSA